MLWWFTQTTLIAGALAAVATLAGRWKRLGPEARHALWLLVLIKLAIPPFVAWPWSIPDVWPAQVEPVAVAVAALAPDPVALPAPPVEPVATPPPDALPTPSPSPDPPPVMGTPPSPEEVLAGVEVSEDLPRSITPDPGPIESPPELPDPAPTPLAQGSEISDVKSQIQDLKSTPWDWNSVLLAVWLAGSVVVVARRGFKVIRFHRSLADSRPAPDWLVDETHAIGDRVGVRPPPVVATDRVATPLLWCLGRPRLILPEVLIKRLGVDRWPGILAHELAHLARGDHWVVRLELLVEAAWWWNPLFWLARQKLHEQAEIACDARVVRALPERRYAYAEALVDVCEHIARAAIPSPSLGVGGAGAAHSLEGRLHMILRDPIPHRPTRRATLLALLLATLALPAWTLGQQPDAPQAKPGEPTSKPEDPTSPRDDLAPAKPAEPPATAPAAELPPQLPPAPAPASITIESILAAQAKAREGLGNLSFRYVVVSRDQSHTSRPRGGMGGGMGGMGGGMGGAGGGGGGRTIVPNLPVQLQGGGMGGAGGGGGGRGAAGQGFPAVGGMGGVGGFGGGMGGVGGGMAALKMQRVKSVHVQVADVVLGFKDPENSWTFSRYDVLEARSVTGAAQPPIPPGLPARPLAWDRRLVAYNGEGFLALEMAWDRTGPVPFRWLGLNAPNTGWRDSLTSAFWGGPNQGMQTFPQDNADKGINPFDPRPANVLDIESPLIPFLNAKMAHAEVAGVDTVDGREVVRVAWIANADIGLRGLCWLAPELGYAVVRSDATQDPARDVATGRRSWRKRSSDFVKVANLWLPRKVSYEESQADYFADGEPLHRREQEMTFEDYKVAPTLPAETFRPKLAIQTLDDLTGNFTAIPPEVPAGLVDRLAKAIAESKFGPPVVERTVEEPKEGEALPGGRGGRPGNQPNPAPGAARPSPASRPGVSPPPTQPNEAPTGRLMFEDGRTLPPPGNATPRRAINPDQPGGNPAKADPKIIANPAPGFDDPIPTIDPKTDDPISARAPADPAHIDRELGRRFKLDPDAIGLAEQITQADKKTAELKRIVIRADDPALMAAQRKLDDLKSKYQRLWEEKSAEVLEEIGAGRAQTARDEIEVLQARRDGKAAEMQKARAQRDMAIMERDFTLKLKQKNAVSDQELALYEGKLAVTEAELASKKASLDEADALLNQSKRRLGVATAAKPAPDLIADPFARSPLANGSKDANRDVVGLDAQDEVEFRQARRDGKAAELQKAEARLEQAKLDMNRASSLMTRNAIDQKSFDQTKTDLKLAEAEVEGKKADLDEANVFLNQAKRRLSGRPTTPSEASTSGERLATLAELRDAIELTEVQLQGKQAELRKVQAMADLARRAANNVKQLVAKMAVSKSEGEQADDKARAEEAALEAKKAEVLEVEVRIKQAKRRLDAQEARLKREVERVKARLDWSEGMFKKGYVPKATYDADKASYDELMIQLDSKYVPAPAATPSPDVPSRNDDPSEPKTKPQAMRRGPLDYFAFAIGTLW